MSVPCVCLLWLCVCMFFFGMCVGFSQSDQVKPKLFIIHKFVNGFLTFVSIRRHFHLACQHISAAQSDLQRVCTVRTLGWSHLLVVCEFLCVSMHVFEYENIIWLLQIQPQIRSVHKNSHPLHFCLQQSFIWSEMLTNFSYRQTNIAAQNKLQSIGYMETVVEMTSALKKERNDTIRQQIIFYVTKHKPRKLWNDVDMLGRNFIDFRAFAHIEIFFMFLGEKRKIFMMENPVSSFPG